MLDISPDSVGNKFRKKRIDELNQLISEVLSRKDSCKILDIGGTYNFWLVWKQEIDWQNVKITCVNLDPTHGQTGRGEIPIEMKKGNGCSLPNIADNEFDIVFSNSVIEHVGLWDRMMDMAGEIRRIAPRYLVQTPSFWFPFEPHARTPLLHWMPESLAYRIVMARKCGFWDRQDTVAAATLTVQSAKLLDYRQMQALFPDANIIRERFLGLTKSFLATKS